MNKESKNNLSVCTLQDTKILLYNHLTKTSRISTPFPEAEDTQEDQTTSKSTTIVLSHALNSKNFLITNSKKELILYKITDEESLKYEIEGQIILPKKPTHYWVHKSKFYYWDKFGDVNSVQISDIKGKRPEDNTKPELIEEDGNVNPRPNKDIVLHESGNFCTLTCFYPFKFENGDIGIGIADEYYKIRVFDFPELHNLKTSVSFKKRFVNSMFYKKKALWIILDNMRLYRVDGAEIEHSENDLKNFSKVENFDFKEDSHVVFVQSGEETDRLNFFVNNREVVSYLIQEEEKEDGGLRYFLTDRKTVLKAQEENVLVLDEIAGDWEERDGELEVYRFIEMNNLEYEVVAVHEI